jgi:hypothetical protein
MSRVSTSTLQTRCAPTQNTRKTRGSRLHSAHMARSVRARRVCGSGQEMATRSPAETLQIFFGSENFWLLRFFSR